MREVQHKRIRERRDSDVWSEGGATRDASAYSWIIMINESFLLVKCVLYVYNMI